MSSEKKKGQLIVLSGPSGVGKSTVISTLLQQREDLYFSVSFTTRDPRPGEQNGVQYFFVDRAEFERMIREGELLEYAQYVDHYYGTSLKLIREHLEQGIDVLLDIEVQGAAEVRAKCPEAVLIFLIPPSFEELARRLRGRKTNGEQEIQKRLEQAKKEFACAGQYDYLVVNDQVEQAAARLQAILCAEGCRTKLQLENYKECWKL